jgi:predicted aldo/keto reductase-like oxidoreductase
MHMLTDTAAWARMTQMGIVQWLEEKKRTGAIGQVGFSYHGNTDMFCRLIDAYDWDFCQIQYNYMDEHSQAGRRGLHYAYEKGIPVVIMEPLRGGKLVSRLPQKAMDIFASYPISGTPAQWALRWLWDQKEVTVVLSGMNSQQMIAENMQTASETAVGQLTDRDQQMLQQVLKAINKKMKVGCTGCGYCMPCPKGVDIPGTFAAYNRLSQENRFAGIKEYFMCTAARKTSTAASNCIGCGKCEKHCPQGLPIRAHLQDAQKELEIPVYRIGRKLVGWFTHF